MKVSFLHKSFIAECSALVLFIVLMSFFCYTSAETGDNIINLSDWGSNPGITLGYSVSIEKNEINSTLLNNLAETYHFNDLDTNFFGEPQVFLQVDRIPKNTTLEEIAAGIIEFSGPLQISQWLNEKSINVTIPNFILPVLVPINLWGNLTYAIQHVPNVLEVDQSSSSFIGEYTYTIHSAQMVEGYITHYYFIPTWQDNDGVLQAITIEIQRNNQVDRVHFILSSQKEDIFSFLDNPWVLGGIFVASILITIPIWKYQRRKEKERYAKMSELRKQELEQGIGPERREVLEDLTREFPKIKQIHKTRWIISIISTIAIIGAGFFGLQQITTLNLNENLVLVIFAGGMLLITGFVFWLSWPIWKVAKLVYPYNSRKQNLAVDISPLLLIMCTLALFLIYSALFSLESIQTWYGRLLMGGLAVILLVVVGFAFRLTNPWKRMEKIEEDLRQTLYHA